MQRYSVTGMSCAACSARVEKAVSSVPGVNSCTVSLLTNSMGVEGTASPESVISAVRDAGYGASLFGTAPAAQPGPSAGSLEDTETPKLRKRLFSSLIFLLILMYIAMGGMLGLPVPAIFKSSCVTLGITELLLAEICMLINRRFFISGLKGLCHRAPNMDTLVALGSGASFVYSTAALLKASIDASFSPHYYFESSAMILTLITVGKLLEARSKGKTTDALKGLMKLAPETAVLVIDDQETVVGVTEVKVGDIFAVRPGESIPVDGVIIDGGCAVDESSLTGESIPTDKLPGDRVSAGTVNKDGFIRCKATRVGEDTTLSQIIQMVSDAAATKAPIAKIADKVSAVFVPAVMSLAVLTFTIWLAAGRELAFALARAISVLVISCPCALGLATPVAIMVGSGVGAKNGILFKTAASLEETGRVEIIALDKTGTVTEGRPTVTDIIPADGILDEKLICLAAAVEKHSEHPLAAAVVEHAEKLGAVLPAVSDFKAIPGRGITAELNGEKLSAGSMKYISNRIVIPEYISERTAELSREGKTALVFASGNVCLGVIAVADTIRHDSVDAVKQLKNMGIKVVMLTGDSQAAAEAIGREVGIDSVCAEILPGEKEYEVRKLKRKGKIAMVGDGINDAPALTAADIGIAIGAGADIAVDAADVVLMNSSLCDAAAAIRLSRAALTNIKQNLFWAFFYNLICIPVAAGALIPSFGLQLNPMIAAAAMSLSSFTVVTNALRLNLFRLKDASKDKKINYRHKKEDPVMEKTMKIEGMMCPHCEARVKKALEEIDGVESAVVSHEAGTAVVTGIGLDDSVLKAAVDAAGYPVLDIE